MGITDNNGKNIPEQDEQNLTEEDKNLLEKDTPDEVERPKTELLSLLTDEFYKYWSSHKKENISPEEMFLQFLKEEGNQNKHKILESLELKLWRKITFLDIRYLYLKSGYTIEKTIYKDIFKDFKRKDAVKSVVRKLEDKINNILESKNLRKLDFSSYLQKNLEEDGDVEKLLNDVHSDFYDLLLRIKKIIKDNDLYKEDKQELEEVLYNLQNTVVTNDELLNQMLVDKVIDKKEYDYLTGDVSVSNITSKEKEEIDNIFTTLFNWSLVTTLSDFIEVRNKVALDIEKFQDLWNIKDSVVQYLDDISDSEVDIIYNQIKSTLSSKDMLKFDECNDKKWESYKFCKQSVKKEIVLDKLNTDMDVLIKFIETKDIELSKILKEIKDNGKIEQQWDKNILFSKMIKKYILNSLNFISNTYRFNDIEKQKYQDILEDLFDPRKNTLEIRNPHTWQIETISVSKTIDFADDIKKIEEEWPRFILDILWDDIDLFKVVFPNYFVDLDIQWTNKQISKHSKVKIKKNDGTEIEWYLWDKNLWNVCIYENIGDTTVKEEMDIFDILDVEELDKKLSLENSDLPKLLLGFVSTLEGRNYEQWTSILAENNANVDLKNVKTEQEKKEVSRDFWREWKKIQWDDNLSKPEVGSVLQFKWKSVNIPWLLNNWYYAQIVEINEDIGTMKLKIDWWFLNFEWDREYEVPMTENFLKSLKYKSNWNVYKFEKIDKIWDFANYINNLDFDWDNGSLNKILWNWKEIWIKEVDWKLAKKDADGNYKPINYIWRQKADNINNNEAIWGAKYRSDLYDVWNVEYKWDRVILTVPEDKSKKKEMDLNTFLTVVLQNNLSPWTDEEYNNTKDNFKDVVEWPNPKIWYALNDLLLAGKNIKDAFLYHFKQDDELRAAMMYENLTKMMPWVWFLKDIKLEAEWEKESKLWRVIEDAKSRLERAWEWKWENHGKKAAAIIKEEIFTPVLKWKTLSTRHKLKAAWYLLYAMEKWPGPYFRALADDSGKWVWVKALLWEEHYKKWKNRVTVLQEKLRNNPDDQQARNDLVLSEMFYIKDQDTSGIFSARFWPTLEWLAIEVTWSMSKAEKVYEWEQNKGSYDLIYDGFNSYIWNDRPPNVMWALKALSERVETREHYVDYHKAITSLIFSGYLYNSWWNPYREEFDKICRTYSVPIWLFARETNWLQHVLRIFDYIVKSKWIRPGWKDQTFTEYLYEVKDPDSVNIFELNNKSKRKKVLKLLQEFWGEYGEEVVSVLNYSDTTLFNWVISDKVDSEKDNSITDDEKRSVDLYFWKVTEKSLWEDWEISKKTFKTSYAPYYQDWVLNMSSAAFQEYALKLDDGDFDNKEGVWIWEWLIIKLDKISDYMKEDQVFEFVFKKFMSWFWRNYKSKESAKKLLQALRSGNKEELNDIIVNHLSHSIWWHHGEIPPEMEEWLYKFVDLFSERPSNIDSIINEEFKKSVVEDSYLNYAKKIKPSEYYDSINNGQS